MHILMKNNLPQAPTRCTTCLEIDAAAVKLAGNVWSQDISFGCIMRQNDDEAMQRRQSQ
jgi:hypothetical protein